MRIAMWSGPRNLSTAMMYAFAERGDCAVMDEPFYAVYLAKTGLQHPMRNEILASLPQDPGAVIAACRAEPPKGKAHVYQKHMAQHMVPGIDRGWLADVVNVFLIRHPARVIASYGAKREQPTLDDVGFRQQYELFRLACAAGQAPPVIDSEDIRADPEATLTALCSRLGLDFDRAMLRWPPGGRSEDGVWAPIWYDAVHRSTGFAAPEGDLPALDPEAAGLCAQCLPYYEALRDKRLRPGRPC